MATDKLTEIRKQMAVLEKQEAKLLKKNRTAALKEIKRLVAAYSLTAADMAGVLPKARRGRKPGSTTAKKRGRKPGPVPGARRGRKPKAKAAKAKATAS